eukprot:5705912-Pyramimonas_sp.AAC.1
MGTNLGQVETFQHGPTQTHYGFRLEGGGERRHCRSFRQVCSNPPGRFEAVLRAHRPSHNAQRGHEV